MYIIGKVKKLKRVIFFVIVLMLLFFTYQFVVLFFTHGYQTEYIVQSSQNKDFAIKEEYNKDYYLLNININNLEFPFYFNDIKIREKKIVSDILYHEFGDNFCIYPVLKEKKKGYVLCSIDGNITTSTASHRDEVSHFLTFLSEQGHNNVLSSDSEQHVSLDHLQVYKENLYPNHYLNVYHYKGLYLINKDSIVNRSILGKDAYDNPLGTLAGKYYFLPDYEQTLQFGAAYIYNVESQVVRDLKMRDDISYDSYVNGVIDNKVYITDRKAKVQYEFNLANSKVEIIGNLDLGGQYYNGTSFENLPMYEFLSYDLYFESRIPSEIVMLPVKSFKKTSFGYLYESTNHQVCVLYKNATKPVVLIDEANMDNVILLGDYVYYRVEDMIYSYHLISGVRKVLYNPELKYNHNNIFSVYVK